MTQAKKKPSWTITSVQTEPLPLEELEEEVGRLPNARVIDISLIYPDPDQPRKTFDREGLEDFARSLKHNGQIQPILVYKETKKRYIIQSGERRWRAAKIAGFKTLDCIVERRKLSESELRFRQFAENHDREGFKPFEIAQFYQDLIEKHSYSYSDLAERFNTSKANISKALSPLKLSLEERHLAKDLVITEIYEVSKVESEQERRQLINQFVNKQVTAKEVRSKKVAPKEAPARTKKKKTVDGLEIQLNAQVRFTRVEIAARLRKCADLFERDGRSNATAHLRGCRDSIADNGRPIRESEDDLRGARARRDGVARRSPNTPQSPR